MDVWSKTRYARITGIIVDLGRFALTISISPLRYSIFSFPMMQFPIISLPNKSQNGTYGAYTFPFVVLFVAGFFSISLMVDDDI